MYFVLLGLRISPVDLEARYEVKVLLLLPGQRDVRQESGTSASGYG